MTFLALIAIIFFGFAVYNLTCAFVDIPTKKTSQMMMLSRKQQGTKNEKLLDVYVTKIAGWIAPYLRLDRLKRNKVQRALDIAGLQLTPEVYTARAWVTAGAVGLCAIPMAFLIPLLVPILIGLAVALWFSTYYAAFDFVKKRRKLIEGEIPRFALTVGQSLENDRDVALEYPSRKEKIIRHYMTKQAPKRSLHFSALELFLYYFHKVASSVVTCAVSGWI